MTRWKPRVRVLLPLAAAIAGVLALVQPAAAATPLPRYSISADYVAGVSSGAAMSTQLQVAYASKIKGNAVFSGPPYYCAQGSALRGTNACASNVWSDQLSTLESDTSTWASQGLIDSTSNLGGRPVWVFHGTKDTTVAASVVGDTVNYFNHFGSSTTYNSTLAAGHAWISPLGPGACSVTASPYINNCGYDAEHDFLTRFFGSVNAPNTGTLTGTLISFDQNQYSPGGSALALSLDNNGYAYVPSSCAGGASCRLVVALHGCLQSYSYVGLTFVQDSYLEQYADTNNMVVLFPQVIQTSPNPNACWDWWGYSASDGNYAQKAGKQMTAVMNMVAALGG
jgi:poly(3-hydroxybutyrate) depolymerase